MKHTGLAILMAALLGRAYLSQAADPFLDLRYSNNVLTVTWTNYTEIRLQESTNGIDWTASGRPFEFIQGWNRLPVSTIEPSRIFRMDGGDEASSSLRFEHEFGRYFLVWPYPSPGRTLYFKEAVEAGDWQTETRTPKVVHGYKTFSLPVTSGLPQFRLSRPLNHVLIVGQSLAVGVGDIRALSTEQPFQNKMFSGQRLDGARYPMPPEILGDIVPLIERTNLAEYTGETIASGFANAISSWVGPGEHDLLVSNSGRSGARYTELARGSDSYQRGLTQVGAGQLLCSNLGYQFRAIFAVHGEADSNLSDYDLRIREWQQQLSADFRNVTGQLEEFPMFHTQISAWGNLHASYCLSPFLTLAEHELNPGRTVLVGPKYFLPYHDGLHLTSEGYRWLGEYYAKAYRRHVIEGTPWSPLRPTELSRSNEWITVTFTGQVGDLVLDEAAVSNPQGQLYVPLSGRTIAATVDAQSDELRFAQAHTLKPGDVLQFGFYVETLELTPLRRYFVNEVRGDYAITLTTNWPGTNLDFTNSPPSLTMLLPVLAEIGPYGFEYSDSEAEGIPARVATTIESVHILPPNQIRIRLSRIPTGTNQRLRYAYTARKWDQGGFGGPLHGPRGCLRDSDPTPSLYGNTLYNWCVHFDKAIP